MNAPVALVFLGCVTLACGDLHPNSDCGPFTAPRVFYDQDPVPRPGASGLTLTGTLESEGRISTFVIGGARVTATADNFGTWSVNIPVLALDAVRTGGESTLRVTTVDTCGTALEHTEIIVPFDAPLGEAAPGLAVSLEPLQQGECYLPGDGRASGRVLIDADLSAEGVPVAVVTTKGRLLGVKPPEGLLVLRAAEGERAQAQAILAAESEKDTVVFVSASAGSASDVTDALIVAIPPLFSPGLAGVVNGAHLSAVVSTAGRLKRCIALSTGAATVVATAADLVATDILGQELTFNNATCGQSVVFDVQFEPETPAGAAITLRCDDSYGQSVSKQFVSEGDPD